MLLNFVMRKRNTFSMEEKFYVRFYGRTRYRPLPVAFLSVDGE